MNGLRTERLRLRRWEDRDRPVFHRLNSDETVMRFFSFRRSREEADRFMDDIGGWLDRDGFSYLALERLEDTTVIGMAGMSILHDGYPFSPAVEIGWRLLPEATGRGYATEAARPCLRHAFEDCGLDEVVTFCVVENRASEAVMQRLGFRYDGTFDHPKVDPATHAHLARHKLYRLGRDEWRASQAGG